MLLLGILIVPVALTLARHVENQDYALTIDDNILKDIRITGNKPDDLNLSNLGLRSIDKDVFTHWSNLKTLNLAGNSFVSLPESVFSSLSNLEHLNLANNSLQHGHFYNGLTNLKTLIISHNPIACFVPSYFFGLTNATKIVTQGLYIDYITTMMFDDPSITAKRPPYFWSEKTILSLLGFNPYTQNQNQTIFSRLQNNHLWKNQIEVDIQDGHLKSVQSTKKQENLEKDGGEINHKINLNSMSIKTFENGWFRLQDSNVNSIYLGNNSITNLTKELMNDLPSKIIAVILNGNQIERLESGIIENANLMEGLDLSNNRISEIEDGALEKLNLTSLILDGNRLSDTKFLDSLPTNIQSVSIDSNAISEISAGNFSKFTCFSSLSLRYNNITELKAQRLRGFSSLNDLDLSETQLTKIEPGSFQDLKNLKKLQLHDNLISTLDNGVFSGLDNIIEINLFNNRLTNLPIGLFSGLTSLQMLSLSNNQIDQLRAGTFVNVPKIKLDLVENRIRSIEKGSFHLPDLLMLMLNENLLTEFDGDSFEGLDKLEGLMLSGNRITTIKKGAAKNLNNLSGLDLSDNPIKRLENGALFGLSKTKETRIMLLDLYTEVIEGGIFNDV